MAASWKVTLVLGALTIILRRDRLRRRTARRLPQAFTHLALIDSAITLNRGVD